MIQHVRAEGGWEIITRRTLGLHVVAGSTIVLCNTQIACRRTLMDATFSGELRLLLEELCCDLCRLRHVAEDNVAPEDVTTIREVRLATPGAFADIVVTLPRHPAYFVEIKYGLSIEETVRSIRRKYGVNHRATCNRLIVVVRDLDAAVLKERLSDCVCSSLDVAVWGQ